MKEELEQQIYEAGPIIFREFKLKDKRSWNEFHIFTGNGWFNIILELVKNLENIAKEWDDNIEEVPRILQIKEKFGMLRCYIKPTTDVMYKLIDKAELDSSIVCESCGNSGKKRSYRGWIYTLCDECESKLENGSLQYY